MDNNSEILGIDAVILLTSQFDRQLKFYRDILAMKSMAEYSDAAFLQAGAQTVGLFGLSHHPEAAQRLRGASHGLSHLEFAIGGRNFERVRHRLDDVGARAYRDNFQDEDGNLFHFNLR